MYTYLPLYCIFTSSARAGSAPGPTRRYWCVVSGPKSTLAHSQGRVKKRRPSGGTTPMAEAMPSQYTWKSTKPFTRWASCPKRRSQSYIHTYIHILQVCTYIHINIHIST